MHAEQRSPLALQLGDYGSVMVNYAIIGFAVFQGHFFAAGATQGEAAARVSLASFNLIMVANALTSILDTSRYLGEAAGHAARICDFVRAMSAAAQPYPGWAGAIPSDRNEFAPADGREGRERAETQSLAAGGKWRAALLSALPATPAAATASPFITSAADPGADAPALQSVQQPRWFQALGAQAQEMLPVWGAPAVVTSAFGTALPDELRTEAAVLLPPTDAWLQGGSPMDVSVHAVEAGRLREALGNVFLDLPVLTPVIAICTFQPVTGAAMRYRQARSRLACRCKFFVQIALLAGPHCGTSFASATLPACIVQTSRSVAQAITTKVVDSAIQTADAEMGHRLALFAAWESVLCDHFTAHGFWCNSVDPRTGAALRGAPGAKYSEAIGAQVFRGYRVSTHRLVSVVEHPRHGVHTYPVTTFTTAPLVYVQAALAQACVIDTAALHGAVPAAPRADVPLLTVRDATVAARRPSLRGTPLRRCDASIAAVCGGGRDVRGASWPPLRHLRAAWHRQKHVHAGAAWPVAPQRGQHRVGA